MKAKGSQNDKFIIDSHGWIEYFSDGKLAEKYSKYIEKSDPKNYFTPAIIIYEVFKKFKANYSEEDAITATAHIENCTKVIDIDTNYAILGADTSLNKKLPMADALIYCVASHLNAKLITSDKHFQDLDDVVFIE
jgi:predicted nucleic acid-binding protein